MAEKRYRVRAMKSIRAMEGDEPEGVGYAKYFVPGRASAVFTCSKKRMEQLQDQGAIVVLGDPPKAEAKPSSSPSIPSDDAPSDAIPLDFPYRKNLVKAGLKTLSAVREFPDLTEIDGIGEAYAERIQDALDELDGAGEE